jgi:hypothetical protein
MTKLKTFLQISDIHISDASLDGPALALYALLPKMDGFLGHSFESLTMLDLFFADLVQNEKAQLPKNEKVELIVTGDLTRVGAASEFDMARDFLEKELKYRGKYIGLRHTDFLRRAIPGNHDHYPGIASLIGGPTRALGRMFPKTFAPITVPLGPAGHELTFLRIDTDADVNAWLDRRWRAQASFVSQLNWLRKQLSTAPRKKEIRILLLHHSVAHRGVTLQIDNQSREELLDFVVNYGVAVLLSGHIHEPPLVKKATAVDRTGNSADYLESRCGTTTQKNLFHVPYYWRNTLSKLGIKKRGHWSNTLLVHRVTEEKGEIFWESELFLEGPNYFETAKPSHLFCMVDPKVRVWPLPVK